MHWIDPDHLPETVGTIESFLLNPHGVPDGMILAGGVEVHVPSHLGPQVVAAAPLGSTVRVRGVRPRGVEMVSAVLVEAADGTRILDAGPPDKKAKPDAVRQTMQIEGVVRQKLHGPKGEVRGALLQDGRTVRFPAHAAAGLGGHLAHGAPLAAQGKGVAGPLGTVVEAEEAGASMASLQRIGGKPPTRHGPKGNHRHDETMTVA